MTDVLLTHSPDAGGQWFSPEIRIDTDAAGAGHSLSPVPCCGVERAYAVWYDQRHGPGDVYFNRVDFGPAPE